MIINKMHFRLCITAIIISVLSLTAEGQQKTVIIDTSDYLPYPDYINTNLMIASSKGYTSEIHRLIKLGADVNATDFDNISPLIYAVANNNLSTAQALLDHDAETNIISNSGESALHIAAKENMLEIAEALIRSGADTDIEDKHEASPLHYASAFGYLYMSDLLIYYDAEIDYRDKEGNTPLLSAVYSAKANTTDLLIQSGSNPDIPDNEGYTPLIVAAQNNDTLIMSLLLKAGANIYATNEYNYDPLTMAIRNNNPEACRYIIDMIDPAVYKKNSKLSPSTVARKYSRKKMLEELAKAGFKESPKLNFDQARIETGFKTDMRDFYARLGVSFKDPLLKIMINAGFEMKPLYNKVLVQTSEDSFTQYYDKRYVLYAGAGKSFLIMEDYDDGKLFADLNLNVGYMMAARYRGTNIKPSDKFRLMPGVRLRWDSGRIDIFAGYDYMKTGLYRIGPGWFSLGASYDIYFDKARGPQKRIKWY
ncbi:MAG: ankyrin repeat domain-containing protein [Bacteroidales bacterium]|nr:ankyrin repeat domain-containing protein [Bacteroidales bacterium]